MCSLESKGMCFFCVSFAGYFIPIGQAKEGNGKGLFITYLALVAITSCKGLAYSGMSLTYSLHVHMTLSRQGFLDSKCCDVW